MTQKRTLGDVEETALIPLASRASETNRRHPRIKDPKAVQVIQDLHLDLKKYDKLITHECVVARTIMFDQTVNDLIQKYPEALCINLGCDLDDRYHRVDHQKIIWIDLDLSDLIAARRKVYVDTPRHKMIAGSVLEKDWTDQLPAHDSKIPVIIIAEGLFMYFHKSQIQNILHNLTEMFPHCTLVVELMRQSMMKENIHDTVKETQAKFGWGTKSGHELEVLEPKMKLMSEKSFALQLLKSTFVSKLIGLVSLKINNRIAVFVW